MFLHTLIRTFRSTPLTEKVSTTPYKECFVPLSALWEGFYYTLITNVLFYCGRFRSTLPSLREVSTPLKRMFRSLVPLSPLWRRFLHP